ncbi:hypothetical protein QZH41_017941, partial [Actinostola sp. cb2023]
LVVHKCLLFTSKMTKASGKGRGMLQIETWLPGRRPGQPRDANIKPINIKELISPSTRPNESQQNGVDHDKAPPTPPSTSNGRLIAKYNYKANPNQPGGFVEMSLTAGEKLHFVGPHCVNPYWWEARKESGESAFVPATYVMVLEDKVTGLPWLEERKAAKEISGFAKPPEPVFKPYQSAYSNTDNSSSPIIASNYHCEICDKTLNGIKPYQAHMVSKAHKEEVALVELYNS